ncbi:hypothetical protein ACFL0W_03240 [Nanoarchaeota archaeon]
MKHKHNKPSSNKDSKTSIDVKSSRFALLAIVAIFAIVGIVIMVIGSTRCADVPGGDLLLEDSEDMVGYAGESAAQGGADYAAKSTVIYSQLLSATNVELDAQACGGGLTSHWRYACSADKWAGSKAGYTSGFAVQFGQSSRTISTLKDESVQMFNRATHAQLNAFSECDDLDEVYEKWNCKASKWCNAKAGFKAGYVVGWNWNRKDSRVVCLKDAAVAKFNVPEIELETVSCGGTGYAHDNCRAHVWCRQKPGLRTGFQSGWAAAGNNQVTCIKANSNQRPLNFCTDSDGGNEPGVKGWARDKAENVIAYDHCRKTINGKSTPVDDCAAGVNNCSLIEQVCESKDRKGKVINTATSCPGGCEEGVCLEEEQEEVASSVCYDGDFGINYDVSSSVLHTVTGEIKIDQCSDQSTGRHVKVDGCIGTDCGMIEQYCDGDVIKTKVFTPEDLTGKCPQGCYLGKCMQDKVNLCTDTDVRNFDSNALAGKNYGVVGSVYAGDHTEITELTEYPDECDGINYINEQYCNKDGIRAVERRYCSGGCENDVCHTCNPAAGSGLEYCDFCGTLDDCMECRLDKMDKITARYWNDLTEQQKDIYYDTYLIKCAVKFGKPSILKNWVAACDNSAVFSRPLDGDSIFEASVEDKDLWLKACCVNNDRSNFEGCFKIWQSQAKTSYENGKNLYEKNKDDANAIIPANILGANEDFDKFRSCVNDKRYVVQNDLVIAQYCEKRGVSPVGGSCEDVKTEEQIQDELGHAIWSDCRKHSADGYDKVRDTRDYLLTTNEAPSGIAINFETNEVKQLKSNSNVDITSDLVFFEVKESNFVSPSSEAMALVSVEIDIGPGPTNPNDARILDSKGMSVNLLAALNDGSSGGLNAVTYGNFIAANGFADNVMMAGPGERPIPPMPGPGVPPIKGPIKTPSTDITEAQWSGEIYDGSPTGRDFSIDSVQMDVDTENDFQVSEAYRCAGGASCDNFKSDSLSFDRWYSPVIVYD